MLEEILDNRNIAKALHQVESRKGKGGVDGMQTEELGAYLKEQWQWVKQSILEGSYRPKPVVKVRIPKGSGGVRTLGIPTVLDRMLQQAISQWLSRIYEPGFSKYSYGFRPGRSSRQAVLQAREYLREGKEWVVALDLDQFFDRVNHDRLMGELAKRIEDKRTLKLIRSYLNSEIMEGGVVSQRMEGTPQGSPLSPLLSNIVLDELDKELESRGQSFVRYADDCNIYVKSEKSAQRAMSNITKYIEGRLKLKVNREKTKVSRAEESELLGFSFYKGKEGWDICMSARSVKRIKEKMKGHTKRNDPTGTEQKIKRMEVIIRGWVNYFQIARATAVMKQLDRMIRVRLRMGIWKQWKSAATRRRNLEKLGVTKQQASQWGNSSLGCCRVAQSQILKTTLKIAYFEQLGYRGFLDYYKRNDHQLKLF